MITSVAEFIREHRLEGTRVLFPDGHEEPFEKALQGVSLKPGMTLAACVADALPPGSALIVRPGAGNETA